MKRAIHWFRRDLRITDNTALNEAVKRSEMVFPVFILEEALRTGADAGAARLAFLFRSLEVLRQNLAERGYPLIVRRGKSEEALPGLCHELRVEAVFCNKRYEPYAQARDQRLFNILNGMGVGFESFKDAVMWEEREILTKAGNPFTVFTPYSKAWRNKPVSLSGGKLRKTSMKFPETSSEPVPTDPAEFGHKLAQSMPATGEGAGSEALKTFLSKRVHDYKNARDFPAEEGTSQLSPHLRCGTISIRTILWKLGASVAKCDARGRQGCDTFLSELIWREFYLQVLANHPHVMTGSFRREYDALNWSETGEHFQAWCAGMTGYPIVDAAMRCLNETGWMHNRLRMIVAMFLTKDLLLSWQWGERYFMQKLVDGDMAANNGGWQWTAGTGTDAAPYFRIFNPVSQGEKFDPKGEFVKRWVPELANIPEDIIHKPWENPLLANAGKYPGRIVLHEEQRVKCLDMFKAIKIGGG